MAIFNSKLYVYQRVLTDCACHLGHPISIMIFLCTIIEQLYFLNHFGYLHLWNPPFGN